MLSNEEPPPSAPVNQPDGANPQSINYQACLVQFMTFDIPTFHASLATRAEDSVLDLKAAVPVWKAVRNFSSVLLAALVATSFKESTQVNATCWFFITASMLQASVALISSTIFIIFFSNDHHEYLFVDVDRLRFLCWSIWDHFSFPGICSVWGMFTLMVALVVDAMSPDTDQNKLNNCSGQGNCGNNFMIAKVMLSLVICFIAIRFGFFMLHLRRISQTFGQSEPV